jgi:N12 class adenine-specific DNA methylase
MCAAIMEGKRLGLHDKALMCVPNHITEQIDSEFLRLYPAANILVTTKKDFTAENRKRLTAKIATGDWDAVIIGHSQLKKIPISQERQESFIQDEINELTYSIEALKEEKGEQFTIKQMEKMKANLEVRLERLAEAPIKDSVADFEELGVDKLVVDESHYFKNLYSHTKMSNVAGLQSTESQKATDLYLKCKYLDEQTGGEGIIFATATPVDTPHTSVIKPIYALPCLKMAS